MAIARASFSMVAACLAAGGNAQEDWVALIQTASWLQAAGTEKSTCSSIKTNDIDTCPQEQCYGDNSCCWATGECVGSTANMCQDANTCASGNCGSTAAPSGGFPPAGNVHPASNHPASSTDGCTCPAANGCDSGSCWGALKCDGASSSDPTHCSNSGRCTGTHGTAAVGDFCVQNGDSHTFKLCAEAPTPAPTDADVGTTSTSNLCHPDSVAIDFASAPVYINNLGGLGPWGKQEMIRYKKVLTQNGRGVDLSITNTSAYTAGPAGVGGNGRTKSLALGRLNIKVGTSVGLKFEFTDSDTKEPVVLKHFEFTFFDLDQDHDNGQASETLVASGFESYKVADGHELRISEMADGKTAFKSTLKGNSCDNPTDPMSLSTVTCDGLTVDQEKRAVMLLFADTSSFEVTYSAEDGHDGRNLLFAGASSLTEFC